MYLSTFSILLPLLLGAVFFRYLATPLRVLYILVVLATMLETWVIILNLKGLNNLFLFNYYTLIEFAFISGVFTIIFQIKRNRVLIAVISTLVMTYMMYSLFTNDLNEIDSQNRIIESSVIIVYSLLFIAVALNKFKAPYLEMNTYFVLISGWLIYFVGTIFVFLLSNHLDESNFMPSWSIHSVLNIFLNIIYASVIWRSK